MGPVKRVLFVAACTLVGAAAAWAADADLILHNGKIVTVDDAFSIQQAVAIRGDRIVAAGADKAILDAERSAHTKVIDLHGRMVLPGLFDSHLHALEGGLSEFRAPLPALDSFAAIQSFIRQQAARTPQGRMDRRSAHVPDAHHARCECRRASSWMSTPPTP